MADDAMQLAGVEIPLAANLTPFDQGIAQLPAHVTAAAAKIPAVKISADLSGANVVASQAVATVNTAGQAAVAQVNAVGAKIEAVNQRVAASVAKVQQAGKAAELAGPLDSFGGMATFRQMKAGGLGAGGGGGSAGSGRRSTAAEAVGVDAFLNDAKRQIGEDSAFGKMMRLGLQGGAIGLAASAANDLAVNLEKGMLKLAAGETSAGELTAELLREVPIAGKLGDALARVHGLLDGSTLEVARIQRETARADMVTGSLQAKMAVVRQHSEAIGEYISQWNMDAAMVGLDGAAAKLAQAARGFGERGKQLLAENAKVEDTEEMKTLRANLSAAREAARKAQGVVAGLGPEGTAIYGAADKAFNETDRHYRRRKLREADDAQATVDGLAKQLADLEQSLQGVNFARGLAASVKLFGAEVGQVGKDEMQEQLQGTGSFLQGFFSRGAQAVAEANKAIRDAQEKMDLETLSEGDRFLAEMRKKTSDPAALANARRVAERMDARAGAKAESDHAAEQINKWTGELDKLRNPKEILEEKLGEIAGALEDKLLTEKQAARLRKGARAEYAEATNAYTRYELTGAMEYGSGEMAQWQASLQQFVARQQEQEGDPGQDTENLKTTAEATKQMAAQKRSEMYVSVTLGGV